ncbi:hypothetical protein [Maribacter sp. 2304DJ31-5]|uniref:hypothetical protein n=1 Tax=Maribacter sp. 2304DJ31-5 TaxID=3386273 RepID=UPI0039BD61D4
MNFIKRIFPWKRTLIISITVLIVLDVFSFYGLYTNKFYFLRIDNYIFPLLSVVHFVFLYAMWFKIKEGELSDPPMRNLEYSLYIILLVYLYKLVDVALMLLSYGDYEDYLLPQTFLPFGILIMILHIFLLGLTLLAFSFRKQIVGTYLFDDMNQHVDNWN